MRKLSDEKKRWPDEKYFCIKCGAENYGLAYWCIMCGAFPGQRAENFCEDNCSSCEFEAACPDVRAFK